MEKYPEWDDHGDPQCPLHGLTEPCDRCRDSEGDLATMTWEEFEDACRPPLENRATLERIRGQPQSLGQKHWKQDTPKMQAAVLLGAIKGNLSNAESGLIDVEKLIRRLAPLIQDLHDVHEASLPDSWDGIERQ